ncbi:MAG: UDP-N-acetylmuramoyl-tripeptide--D-alanyl-D-alanine ligase [Blautia sp.]|nr:UDP-N-acetylmuramoyl-tripeptide--D-alanyl-D-alanine ligase [Blautia sp.]
MKNLTLENLARVTGGIYNGPVEVLEQEVSAIVTDSRKVGEGCLFVPIKGARVDGHSFIPSVMEAGALATLSEEDLGEVPFPWIQVESSLQAVKDMAAFYLEQLAIPVVGVTGSVGKTSTKEAIATVLSEKYRTLKTPGNLNNELGLPLTVFSLRDEDEIAVLEMGINHFGEMTRLAKVAKPETMVITCIGAVHLEYLGDRDGVLKAKTECLPYVKQGGHLLFNGDDDKLRTIDHYEDLKVDYFGLGEDCENRATDLVPLGFDGTEATLHFLGETLRVKVPVPGFHMVTNALAAAVVGKYYGLTKEEIKAGIEKITTIAGRFHIITANDMTLVDDCYNANPMSMKASLDILKQATGRRVAILGDMGELGEEEVELHREVGRHLAGLGIEEAIFVGSLSKEMYQAAMDAGMKEGVYHEESVESLLAHLSSYVKAGDTVLMKASHFMGFERVVEALQK